ncbi:unnamed protein product [Ectocarpus sp. 12 AP-2014]
MFQCFKDSPCRRHPDLYFAVPFRLITPEYDVSIFWEMRCNSTLEPRATEIAYVFEFSCCAELRSDHAFGDRVSFARIYGQNTDALWSIVHLVESDSCDAVRGMHMEVGRGTCHIAVYRMPLRFKFSPTPPSERG